MQPTILFRHIDLGDESNEEFEAAQTFFNVTTKRTEVPPKGPIIGRYSVLPFYQETYEDLGGRLVNTPDQHKWVADIRHYVKVLEDLTPKTYTIWSDLPEGAYVVKGTTNSRKHEWSRRMFAPTKEDVPRIAGSLLDDVLIANQGLVVREYVPLRTYDEGINGMPVTNEWRFFCLHGEIVDGGYYWSSFEQYQWEHVVDGALTYRDDMTGQGWFATADSTIGRGKTEEAALDDLRKNLNVPGMVAPAPAAAVKLAYEVAQKVSPYVSFVVVDVAETAKGEWIVIELNDGQMSGLSCIPPKRFYQRLKEALG